MMRTGLSLYGVRWTDAYGRLVLLQWKTILVSAVELYWEISLSYWSTIFHRRLMRSKRLSCEYSPKAPTNQEVRGQVKNLKGPQLFSLLRLWVAKVLQSTISAPVSPLLSQRKGIQQGLEGPSQSPVAREMGVSLTTMDKSLMTSRQCTLAPHSYHDMKKCFQKHM